MKEWENKCDNCGCEWGGNLPFDYMKYECPKCRHHSKKNFKEVE